MLHDAIGLADDGPVAIRWPRGAAHHAGEHEVGVGLHARQVRKGDGSVCIVAIGKMVIDATKAAEVLAASGVQVTVWDARSVAPIDPQVIADAARHHTVVTVEDGVRDGGIGMTIADQVHAIAPSVHVKVLGLPAKFMPQGSADRILAQLGLDADGITATVRGALTE